MSKLEALEIARNYSLEYEVETTMELGYTPEESLREWDIN